MYYMPWIKCEIFAQQNWIIIESNKIRVIKWLIKILYNGIRKTQLLESVYMKKKTCKRILLITISSNIVEKYHITNEHIIHIDK